MAHELNWTTFMGHEFPMKHHVMETYQKKFNDGAMKNV